jgi:hypothetical protein
MDAEISILFGRSLLSYQHIEFSGIAVGCHFSTPQ